ncbi:transposase mutator type [Evansella cellulosilytica DSM 2522]|uniref:Mutator family transposase n=1 Tax=Evansella cellulosilytica (strain ATCC 21833 / DSM 2522 / FERM P-1141 / JCM 9156 / N-4) TaxID=649639 RepID=E6TXC7_EVAC2|nr:transposase mutator type [Evansella cellulosilytica DSM 2522]
MTQINFTLDLADLKEKIQESTLEATVKASATLALNELMKKEQEEHIQANSYERSSERKGYRNGSYSRSLMTSAGTLLLDVPRTRDGEFSPSVFKKYERIDQAFMIAMIEMVVNGVSTRNVQKVVHHFCGKKVSKSLVSELMKELDPVVEKWRNSPLNTQHFPYVYADAMYIKVREGDRVVSKALHIATGVSSAGKREVLGMKISNGESKDTWTEFFDELKARGLQRPQLVISDAHAGLVSSIRSSFAGTSWQRCYFHLSRNVVGLLPKKGSKEMKAQIKDIFDAPTLDQARERKNKLIDAYGEEKKYESAMALLDEAFDDTTQYYQYPAHHHIRLRTSNSIERLNQEVRKREKQLKFFLI